MPFLHIMLTPKMIEEIRSALRDALSARVVSLSYHKLFHSTSDRKTRTTFFHVARALSQHESYLLCSTGFRHKSGILEAKKSRNEHFIRAGLSLAELGLHK